MLALTAALQCPQLVDPTILLYRAPDIPKRKPLRTAQYAGFPVFAETLAKSVHLPPLRALRKIGGFMAQVIEFYIPTRFKQKVKWVPPQRRGKIIDFPSGLKKSA